MVVDAAHGPFHVDVSGWHDVDVAFGTLHKWLPVPRSVGILWSRTTSTVVLRPAETSLTFNESSLAERFGWPGTFDPASRLAVPEAIALQRSWEASGAIGHSENLADHAVDRFSGVGAVPTGSSDFRPPRLRAFLLPRVDVNVLRQRLMDAGIRAWTGGRNEAASLIRVATHVYNDRGDVDAVADVLEALLV